MRNAVACGLPLNDFGSVFVPRTAVPLGKRLLFASYHCYVDPSSGAAVSARELLWMLAGNGWDVRTFCGPLLDFEEDVLERLGLGDVIDAPSLCANPTVG